MKIKDRTPPRGLQDSQAATREIGQRGGKGNGRGVIGDNEFDPASLIALVEIGTGEPKKLTIAVDSIGDVLGFPGPSGAFDGSDRPEKTISGTSERGRFHSSSSDGRCPSLGRVSRAVRSFFRATFWI